ncbi:hypothetical protein [Dongia sp.]|uniref:hypothetical protein n=1 Tax=Dongia sp. TaxID=1977262 RepID=UPI003751586C
MKLLDLARALIPSRQKPLEAAGQRSDVPALRGSGTGSSIGVVAADHYRTRQQKRSRRTKQAFLLFVIAPTLAAAVYFGVFASDRYVSQVQLVVLGDSMDVGSSNPLLSLIAPGSVSPSGTIMLYNYLQSQEMVENLDKTIGLRQRYATADADFFSRMRSDAAMEDFYEYYLTRVTVTVEPNSPVLTVTTEAFTPKDAQAISQGLLTISEQTLNKLLSKRQNDTIEFARTEVATAEKRLVEVQKRITTYRMQHSEIDPIQAADAVGSAVGDLTKQLMIARAKLSTMQTYLKASNSQVKLQKAEVKSLEEQLAAARKTLAGKSGSTYAALVSEFETLKSEEELAQEGYAKSLEFLAVARGDAQRQHAYVMGLVSPTLPEKSTEPRRVRMIVTVFIVSMLCFGIALLGVTAIREHGGAA